MTAYVAIADSEIDPESPGTTTLFTKLRDNPIAITEGSSGAPNIQLAAMGANSVDTSQLVDGSVDAIKLGGDIGARALISTITASTDATIDFSAALDNSYDLYEIDLINVKCDTTAQPLYARIETSGTTWESGGNIYETGTGGTAPAETFMRMTDSNLDGTTFNFAVNGQVSIPDPSSTAEYQFVSRLLSYRDSTATSYVNEANLSAYNSKIAITGIQFYFASGNVEVGTFNLYGVK